MLLNQNRLKFECIGRKASRSLIERDELLSLIKIPVEAQGGSDERCLHVFNHVSPPVAPCSCSASSFFLLCSTLRGPTLSVFSRPAKKEIFRCDVCLPSYLIGSVQNIRASIPKFHIFVSSDIPFIPISVLVIFLAPNKDPCSVGKTNPTMLK